MAAASVTFESLRQDIRKGNLAPVYLLHGKEGYFIDELVKDFESVLDPEDKEFNQYILYAPQVQPGQVMDIARRMPLMAPRQIVILKECQAARADQINRLHRYVQDPSPSTVLVLVFRGDTGKGKDLMAACKSKAVIFESKEIREYQIGTYINAYIKQAGLTIEPKSVEMLKDYIGSDLSRLFNEIDKVAQILPKGAAITPEVIERNIGISKEYNSFELVDAIAVKNAAKAMRIVNYFASNPKSNPVQMVTGSLFGFFSDLLVCYYTKDKSDAGLMAAIKAKNKFAVDRIRNGMRCYNAFQVIEAIWALRQFDMRSKGNDSRQNPNDLFHDLIYHLLTAPGQLGI